MQLKPINVQVCSAVLHYQPEMGKRYFKSSAAPATATCPKK